MLVRRVARPLLSTVFIVGGIDALRNPQGRADAAAPLVRKGEESLPNDVTDKVPTDPVTLVRVNGAVQVGGGVLLALNKAPRLASFALAGTIIPTTVTEDDFWQETDPAKKAAKRAEFLKNVSLLGGLLIAAADTEGKPSLGWRGRRAAKRASAAVSAALPIGAAADSETSEKLRSGLQQAAERGRELAGVAQQRGAELAEIARERGPEIADVARSRGAEIAETVRDRAPEFADAARERGQQLAEIARDRGPEYADLARSRGAEIAETVRDRAPEFADAARDRVEIARERTEKARKRAEEARKKAAKKSKKYR